jgi:Tfp pilus assembly protein PilZ
LNILRVRCRSAEEFRSFYNTDHPDGGIFCPTTKPIEPEAEVVVEIVCKALPNRVFVRGTVVSWRPALPRLRVRAGALIKFASEEAAKRDFVLQTLDGNRKPTPKRKHTRIPIGLPVKFRLANHPDPMDAELRELSINGALVFAPLVPPLGTDVVMDVVPPGGVAPMSISGRVIYHAGMGQTGIRFVFREGGGSRRLRELVRRFKIS